VNRKVEVRIKREKKIFIGNYLNFVFKKIPFRL
jgi:hypothetical protein